MTRTLISAALATAIVVAPRILNEDVPVYVNNELVGFGTVKSGVTYVPLRVISEKLGADVKYDGLRIDVSATAQKSVDKPIEFTDMLGTWRTVRKSKDKIRIKDVVRKAPTTYSSGVLEFDFELLPGLLSTTSAGSEKPHEIELFVALYGSSGVAYRGNVRVLGVPTDGGRNVLRVIPESGVDLYGVTAIDAEFVAAWYKTDK